MRSISLRKLYYFPVFGKLFRFYRRKIIKTGFTQPTIASVYISIGFLLAGIISELELLPRSIEIISEITVLAYAAFVIMPRAIVDKSGGYFTPAATQPAEICYLISITTGKVFGILLMS